MNAIKKFLTQNYWIQPLLLVLVVFVLVFGLQLIPGAFSTITGWFSNQGKCTYCENVNFTTVETKIQEPETTYVLIAASGCSACETLYPILDRYLKANSDYTVYRIDVGFKTDKTYNDSTMTDAKFDSFFYKVNRGMIDAGLGSIYNASTDTYSPQTPTLIEVNNNVVVDVFQMNSSRTTSQIYSDLVTWFNR